MVTLHLASWDPLIVQTQQCLGECWCWTTWCSWCWTAWCSSKSAAAASAPLDSPDFLGLFRKHVPRQQKGKNAINVIFNEMHLFWTLFLFQLNFKVFLLVTRTSFFEPSRFWGVWGVRQTWASLAAAAELSGACEFLQKTRCLLLSKRENDNKPI